jgi:MSHA biogenesis protein MshO
MQANRTAPLLRHQRGFTLVELIMVIVIMGVIGGMVSVFMKSPIDAYFDSARRAALTDLADTTVRRIARDVRRALPNSLRPPATSQCIEFIPTKTGGRYRADSTAAGLSFAAPPDTSFNMLGSNATFAGNAIPADQQIKDQDFIVVYNLGITGSDAYALNAVNRATVNGTPTLAIASPPEANIVVTTTQPAGSPTFSLESGGNRFHVVSSTEQSVTYVCVDAALPLNNGNGRGVLYRYVRNFTDPHSCPATAPAGAAVLANNVSACSFTYNGTDLQRNATVQINLSLTQSNETISLYHEVHADNTP